MNYLCKPYLQKGEYCVIFGSSGTGKTFLESLWCAAVTIGSFPTGEKKAPGNVLVISGEETFDEIVDRIKRCGGNEKRCFVIDCVDSVGLNIAEGFNELLKIVKNCSPDLLILDPWQCFLGSNVDMNRQNVLRPILQKLTLLAKEANCAVILCSHINKKDQLIDSNNAMSGSGELANAARSAIRLIEDEEDVNRRIAIHTKANHSARGQSLCFRFLPDNSVRWDGTSEISKATLEAAARARKTPSEMLKEKSTALEMQEKLVSALMQEAQNTAGCGKRITYSEMKMAYGEAIFGGGQPKRVLDSMESALKERNIFLQTGLQIRRGTKNFNGFFLQEVPTE